MSRSKIQIVYNKPDPTKLMQNIDKGINLLSYKDKK